MNHWELKAFAVVFLFAWALPVPAQSAESGLVVRNSVAPSLEAYQQSKNDMPLRDCFELALTQVKSATEEQVIGRAILDLLEMSKPLENTNEALEGLIDFIRRNNVNTKKPIVRMAWQARARILVRHGAAEVADALFRTAIEGKWNAPDFSDKGYAFRYYADGLEEAERYADAAILEYEVMTGPHNPVPATDWNMMSFMFYRLWNLKHAQPDVLAVEDVLPKLADIPEHPEYRRIAESFCLMADRRYEEAIALLEEIDLQLGDDPAPQPKIEESGETPHYGEKRNIPLYIAAARFLDGADIEAARANLAEFWRRNQDRPAYVFDKSVVIAHRLGVYPGEMENRIVQVTQSLVDQGFTSDPKIRPQIPDTDIARFFAFHAHGLRLAGRIEEAKAVCLDNVERYFPNNSGSVSSLYTYGHIMWQSDHDLEAARAAFQRIVDECNDTVSDNNSARMLRMARASLIDVLKLLKRPKEEILPHVYELRDATDSENKRYVDILNREIRHMR